MDVQRKGLDVSTEAEREARPYGLLDVWYYASLGAIAGLVLIVLGVFVLALLGKI